MEKMIEVINLEKNYGSFAAIKGISFYVEQGKLFSFLGPNGAGKSTAIDILCTLMAPSGGHVTIGGLDIRHEGGAIRRQIGVVFQDSVLDALLTVRENLAIRAGLYTSGRKAIRAAVEEAAAAVGLGEFIGRPYGKLSGGQRRRADIARALLAAPKILFLDEPTTGLDPQTRKNVWATIRQLQAETGMTVFLTTHYMEEAAASDYVIVIDHGEIAARGTPSELKSRYAADTLRLAVADGPALHRVMQGLALDFTVVANEFIVRLADTKSAIPILGRCQNYIHSFQVSQGTMDDAFIGITGEGLRQ